MTADATTALTTLIGSRFKDNPDLAAVWGRVRSGEITADEARRISIEIVAADPDVLAEIERLRPEGEKVRLPRIAPLVEAALVERAQFDGDMPELRSGPLPLGAAPSVPVAMTARSPIVGGLLLKEASNKMLDEVTRHETRRLQLVEAMIQVALPSMTAASEALATVGQDEVAALVLGTAETDHPDYKRGQLPVPVKVATPTGAELARLTPEQAREAAWKLLSTSQGRRSAQPVIEDLIIKELSKRGLKITAQPISKAEKIPLATHEWTVNLTGKGSTQQAFNFIDMAARVIAAGLWSKLPSEGVPECLLEVGVISRLDERIVGWAAWVFPRGF